MKRYATFFLSILLLAALTACGSGSSPSGKDAPPVRTPMGTKGTEQTSDLEQAYSDLVERFRTLVSDPFGQDSDEPGEMGVLETARGMGDDAPYEMGYLIEDLSGDGIPELAVGGLRGMTNALYTLVDGNRKLEDGNCCKACAAKLSPWFSERRQSTVEDIKAQLEYREANQDQVAAFHATRTLGESTKVILDEDAGKFLVTSARNWQSANPDVLSFSDVTGCNLDIDEDRTEIEYKDREGNRQSFSPKRYAYSYDFYIVIHVNNPYFNEIRFKLNSSKVDNDEETLLDSPTAMPRSRSGVSRPTPGAARPGAVRPGAVPPGGRPMPGRAPMGGGMMGGARVSNADEVRASLEYQQYEQMGQEIREALLQVRQEARDTAAAANAPKTAVTCPYCGATTTPDASGCCEFCGGAIGG